MSSHTLLQFSPWVHPTLGLKGLLYVFVHLGPAQSGEVLDYCMLGMEGWGYLHIEFFIIKISFSGSQTHWTGNKLLKNAEENP